METKNTKLPQKDGWYKNSKRLFKIILFQFKAYLNHIEKNISDVRAVGKVYQSIRFTAGVYISENIPLPWGGGMMAGEKMKGEEKKGQKGKRERGKKKRSNKG